MKPTIKLLLLLFLSLIWFFYECGIKHFKLYLQNTRETAFAIRKLPLTKAKRYLEDVLAHKQAIPFRRFCRGVGRTAQAKNRHSNGQGRWPVKSAKFILDLLKNAESNAEVSSESFICFFKLKFICPVFFNAHLNVNYYFLGQRFGCWCSICFTYPSQSSTEAKTQNIQSPWKNQPYVSNLMIRFNWLYLVFFFFWKCVFIDVFFFFVAAYMSSPCHIELILSEKEEAVQKEVLVLLFLFIFIAYLIVSARFWLFKLNFYSDIFPAGDPVGSKQEEGLNSRNFIAALYS